MLYRGGVKGQQQEGWWQWRGRGEWAPGNQGDGSSNSRKAGGGGAWVTGAGIEGPSAVLRNAYSAKRQQVVGARRDSPAPDRVVGTTTARRMVAGGAASAIAGSVWGSSRSSWRNDRVCWQGCGGARPGGGSSNSREAGGSGEAGEIGAGAKATGRQHQQKEG